MADSHTDWDQEYVAERAAESIAHLRATAKEDRQKEWAGVIWFTTARLRDAVAKRIREDAPDLFCGEGAIT